MTFEPFNEQADALISDLLDRAEAKLVEVGVCPAERADEYLTMRYIEAVADMMFGGITYQPGDEFNGAEWFLMRLGDKRYRQWSNKRKRLCAVQLMSHTRAYFPKYHETLSLNFRHILQSTCGHELNYKFRSVLQLAAATLGGARSEIRRELRRRGLEGSVTLVTNDVLNDRMKQLSYYKRLSNIVEYYPPA